MKVARVNGDTFGFLNSSTGIGGTGGDDDPDEVPTPDEPDCCDPTPRPDRGPESDTRYPLETGGVDPTIVQTAYGQGNAVTFPAQVTSGNTIIAAVIRRDAGGPVGPDHGLDGSLISHPTPFTAIAVAEDLSGSRRSSGLFYRVVDSVDAGNIKTYTSPETSDYLQLVELEGEYGGIFAERNTVSSTTALNCGGAVTPDAGIPAFIVGVANTGSGSDPGRVTPSAGVTELVDLYTGFSPAQWVGYRAVASPSTSYSVGGTIAGPASFSGVTAVFVGSPGDVVWTPAPLTVDSDDLTYQAIVGPDVLRSDFGVAFNFVRAVMRIATETSGSRTYTVRGATTADYSDAVDLSTVSFTALGSFLAQHVDFAWSTTEAYRYYELVGNDETRRIHSWELYEPGISEHEHGYTTLVGDGVEDVFDVVHAIGTFAVQVELWELSGSLPRQCFADVEVVDADTVRVTTTPTVVDTDELRVVVTGVVPAAPVYVPPDPGGAPGVGMYLDLMGPGVAMDSRSNSRVGNGQKVSIRLKETGNSLVSSIAFNWRWGPGGYSAGTSPVIQIRKQTDTAGSPSGTTIGTPITYAPTIDSVTVGVEVMTPLTVPADWVSVDGRVVHYVLENIAGSPTTQWLSINNTAVLDGPDTSPAFDSNFAVLTHTGSWSVFGDLPVIDVKYADAHHDGNAFFGVTVTNGLDTIGIIDGSGQARQTFTPTADVTVDEMWVRVKRISGTGNLTLTLDGTGISSSVVGTGIAFSTIPVGGADWDTPTPPDLIGGRWIGASITATTLLAGETYSLRMSCAAGTVYVVIPIRDAVEHSWGSRGYREGQAEVYDGSWRPAYASAPHDWQCYLVIA